MTLRELRRSEVAQARSELDDVISALRLRLDESEEKRHEIEVDNTRLREKNESIEQWEAQVTEIIQW